MSSTGLSAPAGLVDLAAARVGGIALIANDEFFAEKENLLKPGRGIFLPDKYTDRGKWMEGWESRRRRTPGHDWCVVQLAWRGIIKQVGYRHEPFPRESPAVCVAGGCSPNESNSGDSR